MGTELHSDGSRKPNSHAPVLLKEVIEQLQPRSGQIAVDGTVGAGGHSISLVTRLLPDGLLIAIDRDAQALELARKRLIEFKDRVCFVRTTFANIPQVLEEEGIQQVDSVLLDVGVSSMQLDQSERGFSFQQDGPLDMRMDCAQDLDAAFIVNAWSAEELQELFQAYGEERYSRSIARAIVKSRSAAPIQTTVALSAIIRSAVPPKARYGRLHPATRVFQALRIAVNRELEQLDSFLQSAPHFLKPGGRLAVITFHSLEDRLVKIAFREGEKDGVYKRVTKKPIRAQTEEINQNPRARSAKLRVVERQ